MDVLIRIVTHIEELAALLTGVLTGFGALAGLVLMITRRRTDLPVKLLGTVLVLAVCFAANNGFVYGIGVFVVATLVTELQFLEKLAAIVWNRKEYWEYLGRASEREIEQKIAAESRQLTRATAKVTDVAQSAPAPAEIKPANAPTVNGLQFHRAVIEAFNLAPPFQISSVKSDVKLRRGSRTVLIDAILDSEFGVLFVEIKAGFSTEVIDSALRQLSRQMEAAPRALFPELNSALSIGCVVVVPHGSNVPLSIRGVPILQFDLGARRFANASEVREYLRSL